MRTANDFKPNIVIACGGTGGHLFPGLAVARSLLGSGCKVSLMISQKDVDVQATSGIRDMAVHQLPAVGLAGANYINFARGFLSSYRAARRLFSVDRPGALLAMGGFTSAPPALCAKRMGALAFLHESNAYPGRANRFLSRWLDAGFVGFPVAQQHLRRLRTTATGTPVRPEFHISDSPELRRELGFDPAKPLLLTMGGSQGAAGVNRALVAALGVLRDAWPDLQFAHVSGKQDLEYVKGAYAGAGVPAVVEAFSDRMHALMGGATVAISRSGASSLAELAATGLPALLIPYPQAADNHQVLNAMEYVKTGAAQMLEQEQATPRALAAAILELGRSSRRKLVQSALGAWHQPAAATRIAGYILRCLELGQVPAGTNGLATKRQVLA